MTGLHFWTPARREQLRELVASGLTARDIAPAFGLTRKAIIEAVRRHELGPWLAKPGSKRGDTNHIPADFAALWQGKSLMELAAHYHRSTSTVALWTKRLGLVRKRGAKMSIGPAPVPTDFVTTQLGKTIAHLQNRYGVGKDVIRRWLRESDVTRQPESQALRLIKPNAYATAPLDRVQRDMSNAGQAVDFLRRFGAVYRCNERGGADVKGNRWRRGSAILTDADIIERAERLGWDANAWRRVA
jgi:transposase